MRYPWHGRWRDNCREGTIADTFRSSSIYTKHKKKTNDDDPFLPQNVTHTFFDFTNSGFSALLFQ